MTATRPVPSMRAVLAAGMCATAALLAGCETYNAVMGSGTGVTATDRARLTQSGFLTDYARLKPNPAAGGAECWRDPALDARKYDKMMISRIVVSLAPPKDGREVTVDPSDLKTLTDYFHDSMVKALKPVMPIADRSGPGVVVMRIALTNLVPTTVSDSLVGTLVPYAFIAEAGSGVATGRPAGSTPYLGETAMEMQFRDAMTGTVLAECRDAQIGRKYASDMDAGAVGAAQTWASGYMNSFQAWSYAKNAFDKWSLVVAQRVTELRSTLKPPAN